MCNFTTVYYEREQPDVPLMRHELYLQRIDQGVTSVTNPKFNHGRIAKRWAINSWRLQSAAFCPVVVKNITVKVM